MPVDGWCGISVLLLYCGCYDAAMTSVTTPVNQEPAASIPPIDAVPAPYQPSRFARLHNRLIALPVFLGGAAVLGVASRLQPNPAGLGTHRQLGLPPCQFEQVTGIPCATCGCTTSFSHAANGSLLDAFLTQPFGGLLALMTAMAVIVSGYALVSNMPVMPLIRFISRGRVIAVLLVYMMLAWGYAIYQHVG